MQKKLIIANFKMNGEVKFIENFLIDLNQLNQDLNDIVICASFVHLLFMNSFINNSGIKLGSQDVSQFPLCGAFTGEVNAFMLKDCEVKYVILGHSERRKYFNENNLIIQKKILNCVDNFLIPILCLGEDLFHRENNSYKDFILDQLQVMNHLNLSEIVIAYEPIWAIGTGKSASLEQIKEVIKFIFDTIKSFNLSNLKAFKIVYGGSVNELNYKDILNLEYVDGVLVGSASLDINKFIKIVNYKK